jgi:hypothetical protein
MKNKKESGLADQSQRECMVVLREVAFQCILASWKGLRWIGNWLFSRETWQDATVTSCQTACRWVHVPSPVLSSVS